LLELKKLDPSFVNSVRDPPEIKFLCLILPLGPTPQGDFLYIKKVIYKYAK